MRVQMGRAWCLLVMAGWVFSLSSIRADSGLVIEGVDNVVTQWNAVTQRVIRTLGLPSQISSRTFSFVHLSQYKALQSAYREDFSHPEAAAAYAAHYVLSELFPAEQSPIFDGVIDSQVTKLNLSKEEDAQSQRLAFEFAKDLLRERILDGSQTWAKFRPAPPGGPVGEYQFTPNQTFALYPQLGHTLPFVIKSSKEFDVFGGPLKIPSAQYDKNYHIVATVGNANSPVQTEFEKETARFWEDPANTSTIVGHLFNVTLSITGPNLTLPETSKLFATLSVAAYDSSIVGWYMYDKYRFWRPITAFRQGDPTHKPDPSFTPVLRTPPHPEYPSTHCTPTGTWAMVLAKFLSILTSQRTPNGPYVVQSEGYYLPPRTYNTIDDVKTEVALSRIYGGVHFPKSAFDGIKIGLKVGNYVWDHFADVFGEL